MLYRLTARGNTIGARLMDMLLSFVLRGQKA
jgi:hypothetical protein